MCLQNFHTSTTRVLAESLYFHIYTKSWSDVNRKSEQKFLCTLQRLIDSKSKIQKNSFTKANDSGNQRASGDEVAILRTETCSAGFVWRRSWLIFITEIHLSDINIPLLSSVSVNDVFWNEMEIYKKLWQRNSKHSQFSL